jgi:hypothetical protein
MQPESMYALWTIERENSSKSINLCVVDGVVTTASRSLSKIVEFQPWVERDDGPKSGRWQNIQPHTGCGLRHALSRPEI